MSIPAKSSSSSFASNHFKDAESVNNDAGSEGTLSDSESETCSVDSTDSTTYEFVRRNGISSESASSSSSNVSGVFVRNLDPTPESPSVQAKLGTIELLNPAPGERTYINANQIPLGDDGQQFLGATVRDNSPTAPKELLTLAKAAQAAKLANKRNEKRNEPAEIVQFISPLAFFNPGKSVDQPMSKLIRSYKNGVIEGVGTLTKFEERKNSASSAQAQTPPIRSFTVTYLDADKKEQILVLTEIAPDFRNSFMTANSIKDTVAQLDGKFSEGMLSWGGVGRVAIMRVALEVKQAIENEKSGSVDDKWIQKQVDDAIANLEKYRPKYLSKKLAQRDELIRYLQGVAASTARSQVAPKPEEPSSEKTEVTQKPTSAQRGVQSTPKPVIPPAEQVELKSDFTKNAETLGFVNTGNSCYMNSALKFLMLTQGEALITRLEDAAVRLEKQTNLALKVSSMLMAGSGHLEKSEIDKAIEFISLGTIMIEDPGYTARANLKRQRDAEFVKPFRDFVSAYMKDHRFSLTSVDSFQAVLDNRCLGAVLDEYKEELLGISERIYHSVVPLFKDGLADTEKLTKKLINHLNDLPCYKDAKFDEELEKYRKTFVSECRSELKNVLEGNWSAPRARLELEKVQVQIEAKVKEIAENVVRLESLRTFFSLFKQDIDPTTLGTALQGIRPVFEKICFQGVSGNQQDPAELVEQCQSVFGEEVFFEHAQCSGETRQKENQVQIEFDELVTGSTTSVDFARILTQFKQPDSFNYNELYVVIRYTNKYQLFQPFDLNHHFKLRIREAEQVFQVDSIVFHKGQKRTSGHYLMIQRDGADTWTKHDDDNISHKHPTDHLTDLVPSDSNRCRPVMIRLKKV